MSTFGSPISAIGSAAVLAGAALLLVRRRLLRTYAVNLPDVHAELSAVHTRYEAALAENDVAALDELFFDHPATLRYGPDKSQHGYAAIAAMSASKKQAEDLHLTTLRPRLIPRCPPTISSLARRQHDAVGARERT